MGTDIIEMVLLLLLIPIAGYMLIKEKKDKREVKMRNITLKGLIKEARVLLNNYGVHGFKVNGELEENALRTEESVAEALGTCCSGSKGPRDVVQAVICQWLRDAKELEDSEMDGIIDDPDNAWGQFECAMYMADRSGEHGFEIIWERFLKDVALCVGAIDDLYVRDVFLHLAEDLSHYDRLQVVTRMVYAGAVGLGQVDSLMWQKGCIEEIQLGMSGCTKENYDYREVMGRGKDDGDKSFSRDSIHIMVGGVPIRLPFLTFGSDDELIRVLRNLIKNTGAGELTKRTPRIVADTPDGRRITVSRPPFSDSWAGLVRKFDTVPKLSIEELVEDDELRSLLHEIVRTRKSIAVTGETASGKTTLLRALLIEIGKERSIRVIEAESFELNIREFLPEANTLTLRVSDSDSADRVLGFSKKTTGQVFAVGEVNTPEMAVTLTDIAKTAETILFTAHYKETSDMVSDFTNARLNAGGYSDERLAKSEAICALGIDIHMRRKGGSRCIERISEVQNDGKIKCLWPIQKVG